MRIHEIIEQCVEYISFDGALGSDPTRLIAHLVKLDPSLDHDYFAHLWTLLCAHPSIQVIITNEPILLPGGTIELGTAPLPQGWVLPQGTQADEDLTSLYKEGLRGRQIAFRLAGQEFRSDRQAVQDRKEAARKKAKKAKEANLKRNKDKVQEDSDDEVKVDPSGAGILRVLHVDDSEEGNSAPPVAKTDFRKLSEKWGARLRIRCTDDEIYYRLTGSHAKIPKITSTVFHVLQLAAMSRDKGITAIDLGPLVGASQGSMHYFMKVLVQLGLCAKVPAVLHAAITNILVFHRFLDQNPNYRALVGKPLDSLVEENDADDGPDEPDEDDDLIDPALTDATKFNDWGFDFPAVSEAELMAGHSIKPRLLKMLEHPGLQNHLLRTKNLLPTLGWRGHAVMRHRRAVKRHIDGLVIDGLVERVFVGESRTSCIRLSKFNPEKVAESVQPEGPENIEELERVYDLALILSQPAYTPPLDPAILSIPLTVTFERWIIDLVLHSERNDDDEQRGMTINAIWQNTNYMYKRSIDFAILRSDNAHIPEHLWSYSISSFMETVKKERRLRLYTTAEFQRIMQREGQVVEGYPAMARPDSTGDFGDLWPKTFYAANAQLNKFLDNAKSLNGDTKPSKETARPLKASATKGKSKGPARPSRALSPSLKDDESEGEVERGKKGKKEFKYADSVQVRGRPRKYVHVVEEDGSVNRRIIGTIYTRDDLPQVLVYLKERNILVTAPDGYTGIGVPPPISEQAIRNGHPPQYFYQFPARDSAAYSGLPGRKSKARAKMEAEAAAAAGQGSTPGEAAAALSQQKKGKKRAKGAGGSGSEAVGTPSTARKSKRQKKDINYADKVDVELHEDPLVPVDQATDGPQLKAVENPVPEPPVDNSLIHPALTEPSSRVITPRHSVAPVDQVTDPTVADISVSSPALPVAIGDTRPSKKRGKAGKEKEADVTEEVVDRSKRQKISKKSKAAEEAPQTQDSASTVNHAQAVTIPSDDPQPTPGSRFYPIDIPDENFMDQSMEDSIGNVLAELSHSGVRPRTQSPTNPTQAAESSKKRKTAFLGTADSSSKTSKSAQGKTTGGAIASKGKKSEDNRRISLFELPEEPMEEMPFELPDDIFALAKPSTTNETAPGANPIPPKNAAPEPSPDSPSDPPIPSVPQEPESAAPAREVAASSFASAIQASNAAVAPDPPISEPSGQYPTAPARADESMPPPSLASTPARITQLPNPAVGSPLSRPATPLRELSAVPGIFTPTSGPFHDHSAKPIRNKKLLHTIKDAKPVRVDLGTIRRANELVQVLHDNDGVMMDNRLIHEHRAWTFKYAGTDHPNAPATGYGMDRLVVKKTVNSLLSDGRLKETIVSVPTPTGRWVKSTVLYLSDLPLERLQAYIRQMSTSVSQSMTPNSRKGKPETPTLPATPYTELKRSAPKNGGKLAFDATPTRNTITGAPRPFSERRTALLKELKVVGQLLGWKASRVVRVQILHRAILRALSQEGCGSVASTSPRVFAFPLLCEDITAEEWFSCSLILQYNEEIEHWLRDPVNRATKLKHVPKQYRPLGGFGGSSTKAKMNTLLQIMAALKIVSPVVPVAKEEADFFGDNSESNGFKVENGGVNSTYYVLHDMVPVYHIASLPPPLLGLLPARNEEETDILWSTIKKASLEMQVDLLGRIGEQTKPSLPHSAKVEDTLDLSMDYTKLLQRPKRWKSDLTLLPIQKAALDEVFDRSTGQSSINNRQELEDFAYENALPLPFLEREIKRRAEIVKNNAAQIAQRLREHALKAQERQQSIQEKIRQKLIERQDIARKAWEEKVSSSAQRKSVEYTPELLAFVSQQTIQSGSMKMLDATENVVDYWVMMWEHVKDLTPKERETALEERRRYQAERVRLTAPKFKYGVTSKRKSARKPKPPRTGPQKRVRSKRKWTHEDDDLLIDAEAIIRARSRASGYKGRQAIFQIFPGAVASTIRSRLTKITSQPGKKAYYERLEQAWYELWMNMRGTDELVDENPESPFEFDLKDHIRVLREKIDKRPLRLLAAATPEEEKEPVPGLPLDSQQMTEEFAWKYVATEQLSFDQAADSLAAEEIKINSIGAISLMDESKVGEEERTDIKDMGLLQASMKMIIGTPDAYYDVTHGKRLLDTWSDSTCHAAIQDMMDNNVLKKVPTPSRDNERQYGFTPVWQQLNEGFMIPNLPEAAQGLKPKLEPEEGIEWPIIGEPGELAALMNMVSNHEVDDDAYEFPFRVTLTSPSTSSPNVPYPKTKTCKPLKSWSVDVESTSEIQRTVKKVLEAVTRTGQEGMTKPELLDVLGCSPQLLDHALASLASEREQQVFWTGYDTARLVSVDQRDKWCVKTTPPESSEEVHMGPRRWYDVYGVFREDDFVQVVQCVKGLVVVRPGISLKLVKHKLQIILDRLELIEILEYLIDQNKIEMRWSNEGRVVPPLESVGREMEDEICFFPVIGELWN
uniref:Uncharacterized protein n=1 Tax=Kwoniella bestiolae CBS 10118 TaxID=1296100 RepID=A0A1B9GES2_9TREE|nr:hypothetical protein I302_01041 [Kwoniella bestiolae CBS 10118]OCF29534.1 hypothetical protein I302_01041 [Kwoniella bestiolae CBS 10118]